jgi:S-sulfo-L-cysteine synthase (O-acetyl-L-serine-dependent)
MSQHQLTRASYTQNDPAAVEPHRPVEALIGRTPMVELRRLGPGSPRVRLYAKLEGRNPGGSVKDRAALSMLHDGLGRGLLGPGMRLLDATSGNTGIAFAMLCASAGIPLTLCVPESVTPERKQILRAMGAEVIFTDALEGSDGAIREARRRAAESPELYFYADQYSSEANWMAHFRTTGPEVWAQTGGTVTHFVAGLGTSGTMMGTGRFLKQALPGVRLVAVQPDSPLHGIEGLKHMGSALVPAIYDPGLIDVQHTVATEEAQEWTLRLAREEGLLVGVSSGANFAVARRVAEQLEEGVVVTVFCDGGDRYLSERFWDACLC